MRSGKRQFYKTLTDAEYERITDSDHIHVTLTNYDSGEHGMHLSDRQATRLVNDWKYRFDTEKVPNAQSYEVRDIVGVLLCFDLHQIVTIRAYDHCLEAQSQRVHREITRRGARERINKMHAAGQITDEQLATAIERLNSDDGSDVIDKFAAQFQGIGNTSGRLN